MKPDLSRRQFLARSAGIASMGIGAARAAAAQPHGEIRIGLVGAGDRGTRLLAAFLRAGRDGCKPAARITALHDPNQKHARRALGLIAASGAPAPRSLSAAEAVLTCDDVDAVVIATPVDLHARATCLALDAGKHVYCEKPLGRDVAECRVVLEAARTAGARGLVFQTGFQRRHDPRYQRSVRFLREGEIGKVLFMRTQWHATGDPPRDKPWLFRRERSGDIVLEQACHQFDVLDWVFGGPPLRAAGFGGTARFPGEPPGRDVMDSFGAILEYPGGGRAQMSHVSFAVPERRFSGVYELAFCERGAVDLQNALAWTSSGSPLRLPEGPAGDATDLAARAFLACAASGRRPEAGAEEGHRSALAAILARRAIELGRVVEWKEIEPA